MRPEFRFRLNGVVIPEIRVQRAAVNGESVGNQEIAVNVPDIGWFALDDNSDLMDKDLSRFTLEYRNETVWARVDPVLRRISKDKGWKTVTPQELLKVLHEAGYITADEGK